MRSAKKTLHEFPLFESLGQAECEKLLAGKRVEKRVWNTGQKIEERGLYCVISGTVAVYSADEERPVLLRYLQAGDVFGAANLYASERKFSRLVAENKVTAFVLSREAVDGLLTENKVFLQAYLVFLADRIAYLNKKINYIAAGSAERKLAAWLLTQSDGKAEMDLPVNVSDLAKILDLGRASLYRAFEGLQNKGFLQKEGTHVRIVNKKALETEI